MTCRCGKVHTCPPVDPKAIAKELANDIAKSIDAEVLKRICDTSEVKTYELCSLEEADEFAKKRNYTYDTKD